MAIRYKTSSSTFNAASGDWIDSAGTGTSLTSASTAYFVNQASGPAVTSASSGTFSGTTFSAQVGAIDVRSTANTGYYLMVSPSSSSPNQEFLRLFSTNDGSAFSPAIAVAASKELKLDANLQLYSGLNSPTTFEFSLGNGALLKLNERGAAAGGGMLTRSTAAGDTAPNLNLSGGGTLYVGRINGTPTYPANQNTFDGPITIFGGTLQCDGATAPNPFGTSAITFNASGGSTARIACVLAAAPFNGTSRTIPNQLVFTTAGTVSVDSGFTATFGNNTVTGSGALTKEGGGTAIIAASNYPTNQALTVTGGTLQFNNATSDLATSQTISISSGATLQCSAARAIAASTITGAGTLTLANSSFINSTSGSSFTGTINGDFTTRNGGVTLGARIAGALIAQSGELFLTNTGTHTGYVNIAGWCPVTINGRFTGGGTPRTTILNGGAYSGNLNNFAQLNFNGANSGFSSNITIDMAGAANRENIVTLNAGANLDSNITGNTASTNANATLLSSEDGSNTYTGSISTNQTTGNFKIRSKTNGTLIMSGNHTSNGRVFALNSDPGYAGKIAMTGGSFSGTVTLPQGTLHINSASGVGIGSTLTVSNANTTVACSSSNAAYAAQIVGNLSLGANTVLKFGAPA